MSDILHISVDNTLVPDPQHRRTIFPSNNCTLTTSTDFCSSLNLNPILISLIICKSCKNLVKYGVYFDESLKSRYLYIFQFHKNTMLPSLNDSENYFINLIYSSTTSTWCMLWSNSSAWFAPNYPTIQYMNNKLQVFKGLKECGFKHHAISSLFCQLICGFSTDLNWSFSR